MKGLRAARWLVVGAAPFVGVAVAPRLALPWMADRLERPLLVAASWLSLPRVAGRPEAPDTTPPPSFDRRAALPDGPPPSPPPSRADRGAAPRSVARASPSPRRREDATESVFVPVDRLLGLTAGQLRSVRWRGVENDRGEPAGVRLTGVGDLGVGLADGDVVVAIDGRPTRTEDEATAAGASAWTSGERVLRANLVRGDRPIALAVQLPATRR